MTQFRTRADLATAIGAPLLGRDRLVSIIGEQLAGAVSGATLNPEPALIFYGPGEGLITALKKAADSVSNSLGMDVQVYNGAMPSDPGNTILVVNFSAHELECRGQLGEFAAKAHAAASAAAGTFFIVEDLNKASIAAQEQWVAPLMELSLAGDKAVSFVAPIFAAPSTDARERLAQAFIANSRVLVMQEPSLGDTLHARRAEEASPARSAGALRPG